MRTATFEKNLLLVEEANKRHAGKTTFKVIAGLILTKPSLRGHLIQVSMKGLHLSFQLPLGSSNSLVLNGRVRKLFIDVREFLLSNPPVTVSLLKKSPGLLQSILHGMSLSLTSNKGIASYFLGPLFIFKLSLSFPDLLLVFLDVLLGVLVVGIGVFKSNLKLSNIRLKLLLHPKTFGLALALLFQSRLHAFNGLAHVLLDSHELFILLTNAAFNLLTHLSELKLSPQDLVLFLLKSTFGFFKSCLELKLLSLQTLPDLVNLMDGATSLADLIHDVLDFIAKALVLTSYFIQLSNRFFISCFYSEKLR